MDNLEKKDSGTSRDLPPNPGSNARSSTSAARPEDSSEVMYYYSREHRLARASAAVRELNESSSSRPGLLGSFAGNKSNIFILASILIIAVMFILYSRLEGGNSEGFKLGENSVILSINKTGEGYSLSIVKEAPEKGDPYAGAVDVAVSPVQPKPAPGEENSPPEIVTDRIFFTYDNREEYSLPLPFGGKDFIVILQSENERIVRRRSFRKPLKEEPPEAQPGFPEVPCNKRFPSESPGLFFPYRYRGNPGISLFHPLFLISRKCYAK
jgi:hypothetical protein